jgi:AAA+ superfamily predicted ATPase
MEIYATTQKEMLDEALLLRFDLSSSLELPEKEQIEKLINLVLKEDQFGFDKKVSLAKLIESA